MTETRKKSGVFTDFVAPIGVLTVICLVMALLLALTNGVTAPIIDKAEAKAAEEARMEVMPEADGFTQVELADMPESDTVTVTGIYEADNGAGYVFMITAKGYGGKNTLSMVCGIDMDGKITDTKVLSHSETVGLGAKITGEDFNSQFPGKDEAYLGSDDYDLISGATFSSNYYRSALQYTYAVYNAVRGAS